MKKFDVDPFSKKGSVMDSIVKNSLVTISIKFEDKNQKIIDEVEELMYIHGINNQIFQTLQEHLEGKKKGEDFYRVLSAEEAFGEYDESLLVKEALEDLPEDISIGMELDGDDDLVYIVEGIDNTHASLNANHEFAGKALLVSGKILNVEHLTEEGVQEILKAEHQH